MKNQFDEYRELFLEESEECITSLNENLVQLEKNGASPPLIDNIFRIAHTLKSSAAAVGYENLGHLAHKAEDLMQQIRSGAREVSSEIVDVLFSVFDVTEQYLEGIRNGNEDRIDLDPVLKELGRIETAPDNKRILKKKTQKKLNSEKADALSLNLTQYEKAVLDQKKFEGLNTFLIEITIDPREKILWLRAELFLQKASQAGEILKIYPEKEKFVAPDFSGFFSLLFSSSYTAVELESKLGIDLIKSTVIRPLNLKTVQEKAVLKKTKQKKSEVKTEKTGAVPARDVHVKETGSTIRVPVSKLDRLMNLVGELVITNSGLKIMEQDIVQKSENKDLRAGFSGMTDQLVNITSELQYQIMNVRMLPVSNVFNQFHRIVRDMSCENGKEIDLRIKGGDTELDKKVLDAIGDPLMHLVRNSVDHGLETPGEREKAGKKEPAHIVLAAEQEGNHIIISIEDNGRGMNIQRIRQKAIEKNLIAEQDVENLSDEKIIDFIFYPGFSTAEKVSKVSGRGVGMDVVKTSVSNLNGAIEVYSSEGKGTTFRILLPLTLAITSVIMVESENIKYAIPIQDIRDTINVKQKDVHWVDKRMMVNLREEVLPLADLREMLGKKKTSRRDLAKAKMNVIVVSYKEHSVGLVVDRILGKQDVVLKPLEKHYKSVKGLSGAAIMGDGSIVLVTDVPVLVGLLKENEVVSSVKKTLSRPEKLNKYSDRKNSLPDEDPKQNELFSLKQLIDRSFRDAAGSLSGLTGRQFSIKSSKIGFVQTEDLIREHQGTADSEDLYFSSLVRMEKNLDVCVALMMPSAEGLGLYDLLEGRNPGETKKAGVESIEAIGEVNNILSSSFVNKAADILKKELYSSTPRNGYDMLDALWQGMLMKEGLMDQQILYADSEITEDDARSFQCRMLILASRETLKQLENKAG